MDEKCPKCGENTITKMIQKKIGSGSIDYPIAQICPKCKWSKDLTGAGDIVAKPVMADASSAIEGETRTEIKTKVQTIAPSKPAPSQGRINVLIPIVLAILVLGAIAWVFFINTAQKEPIITTPTPAPTPVVTQIPARTPTSTPTPEVTASGIKNFVRLESKKGFTPKTRTIKLGDEIIWTNEGTYSVTLISSEGLFEEKNLNIAKQMNYTFKKTGTFSFSLKGNDTSLTGTIVVEP